MWFLDTNVFVYTFDASAPAKRNRARTLVKQSLATGKGCVSAQVANEFTNLALRKFQVPLTSDECRAYFDNVLSPMCHVGWSPALFRRALELQGRSRLSWYDALIVSAALEAGCDTLHSEDFQDSQRFGDLVVRNPFV
jgi:predicted nucleic acid-binding protein